MTNGIVQISQAKTALAEAVDIISILDIRDKAMAMSTYYDAQNAGEAANMAKEVQLRAERKAGEFLKDVPREQGKRTDTSTQTGSKLQAVLDASSISKTEAGRWQTSSELPEQEFEKYIAGAKELTSAEVLKRAKKFKKQSEREQEAEANKDTALDIDFRLGDFVEVLSHIPDNSIDLILTDPPYPVEFLPEWKKLSSFAKRVLKPRGFCIAYSGHVNLPSVISIMKSELAYYWTMCLLHTGHARNEVSRNMICDWKPIIVFQKGFKKRGNTFHDVIRGSGREKKEHEWQQGEKELIRIIEHFSVPGDKILDPFAGSGTTLIATYKLNREAIGAEKKDVTYNLAKGRIKKEINKWEKLHPKTKITQD